MSACCTRLSHLRQRSRVMRHRCRAAQVPYASAAIAPSGDHLQCLASAGILDAEESSNAYISKVYRHTSASQPACDATGDGRCQRGTGVTASAVCPVEVDDSREEERRIVERLRSVGGWTNVDVDFGDGPLASFNHNRISGNFLFSNRSSVPDHLARHFIVWPQHGRGHKPGHKPHPSRRVTATS